MTLARARAFVLWAYMGNPLARLVFIEKKGIGTMAVSDKWQVFWDPAFVATLPMDEAAAVLCHEAWHVVRQHGARRGNRDPKLWNIACDIAINDDASLREKLPSNGCFPEAFASLGVKPGMLEEDIYDLLVAKQTACPPRAPGASSGQGEDDSDDDAAGATGQGSKGQPTNDSGKAVGAAPGDGKCGSGAGGEPVDGEDDPSLPVGDGGHSNTEDMLIARSVAEAIKSCGTASIGARRWAEAELSPPTVPWQTILRAAIKRALLLTRGATDYSYRRTKVRDGIILPSMTQPQTPVAIVLDTSGSVSGPLLDASLAEIDGILKAVRIPCTVLACDAQVHGGAQKVTKASAVQALGGGGTDMGKGIAAAAALRPRHGAIVVVTDGYTPWPKQAPAGPCIVCLIGASEDSHVSRDVPPWATKVHVS